MQVDGESAAREEVLTRAATQVVGPASGRVDALRPARMVAAYALGYFPLDDERHTDEEVRFCLRDRRAVILLDRVHAGRNATRSPGLRRR